MSFIDAPIGTRMDCFALVKKSEVRTSAKGSQYLDMDLADKDGEINAKFWAYENSATPNFQPNDIVKIRGTINEYRGTRQFRFERIRPALKTDNVDPADYVAAAADDTAAEASHRREIRCGTKAPADSLFHLGGVVHLFRPLFDLPLKGSLPGLFRKRENGVAGGLSEDVIYR